MSWEQRMADRAKARMERQRLEAMAGIHAEMIRNGQAHLLSALPPDDDTCQLCYEWRLDNKEVGRHAWFRTCDWQACECAHHADEVWMAAVG